MSESNSVSSASADAQINETTPTPTTTKLIEPPAKKFRFDKNSSNKGKRHGGVSYNKDSPKCSLSMVPRRKYFPIFTSNRGCHDLALITFRAIQGRDFRLANAITALQLEYALTIAYCNRVVQTSINYGYAFPLNASRLKQIATGIQLPSVLAQYIESIGMVETLSSASVVPFAGDYRVMFPEDTFVMLDPATVLEDANRPVPPGDWALDTEWIIDFNDATSRASRSGMKFRIVDNADYRGRSEMLTSFKRLNDPAQIIPASPQVLTEAEGQLGATYRFRDYAEIQLWFGENKELVFDAFTGIPFDPSIMFSDICVAAFKGAVVSTD